MKTKIITSLKKELLLVELPENGYWENYRDGTEIRDFLTDEKFVTDYTLLGSPDEIKESVIFWDVNPLGHSAEYYSYIGEERHWRESELRTFDKKRTLIFVKN